MDYNRTNFLSMNKTNKHIFIKNTINSIVKELHNNELNDFNKEHVQIYYLYSDGTIASEKCGSDYTKQIEFNIIKGECIRPCTYFKFPVESNMFDYTYSIMSKENCYKVRNLMDELLLEI